MPPQLVFAYGDQRIKAITDTMHLVDSLRTVHLMVEDRLGLAPGCYDLYDECGRLEQLKDLQRAIHTAGDTGECVIQVKEHALSLRFRELTQENSGLSARVAQLEEDLKSLFAKLERKLDDTLPRISTLEQDARKAQAELSKVHLTLDGFSPKDFMANTKAFTEEVNNRLHEVDRSWQADKLALALVVEQAVKRCHEDMRQLQDDVRDKLDKIEACSAVIPGLQMGQKTNHERVGGVVAELRVQKDEHLRFMRVCASAFEEGAKRTEAHLRESAQDLSAKVEN